LANQKSTEECLRSSYGQTAVGRSFHDLTSFHASIDATFDPHQVLASVAMAARTSQKATAHTLIQAENQPR